MAKVIFYEKPGCLNNRKQKALLQAAGHELEVHNLLTEPWTVESLRSFFGQRPVGQWFNPTAPQIKSGEVIPEQLDADSALALMVQFPLLIRRPLIQVGNRRDVGFDPAVVAAWVGLGDNLLYPADEPPDSWRELQQLPCVSGGCKST